VGALLSGIWAFVQPVLIYYLLFGKTIIEVGEYFYEKTSEAFAFAASDLLVVLAALVVLKLSLSVLVAFAAVWLPESTAARYREALLRAGREKRVALPLEGGEARPAAASARLALGDLFNPLFLVSLALC
jgi:hypothetical protein